MDTTPKKGPETLTAILSFSTSGANELIAAVSGKRIKVYAFYLVPASAVSVTFKSATTALSAVVPLTGPWSGDLGAEPLYQTAAGEAFNCTLSSGVAVVGELRYVVS